MKDQRTAGHSTFGHLDQREKREYLSVLCDVVWPSPPSPAPSADPVR
jgi:hypothetical protein